MQNHQQKPINEVINIAELITQLPLNLTKQLQAIAPANDLHFDEKLPYQVVGLTPYYQVIKKGNSNLAKRYTRWPFIITDNDMLAIELYKLKLAALVNETPDSIWSKLITQGLKAPQDFKAHEEQLVQNVISDLINLGAGEVTLSALNKLIAQQAKYVRRSNQKLN